MSNKNSEGYADLPARLGSTATTALARVARDKKAAISRQIIYVASAYRGDVKLNTERAKRYSRFVLAQGKIPFTPHLLYTQFLDDSEAAERKQGMFCGTVILGKCDELWAFGEISDGMLAEMEWANKHNIPIRYFGENCEEVK